MWAIFFLRMLIITFFLSSGANAYGSGNSSQYRLEPAAEVSTTNFCEFALAQNGYTISEKVEFSGRPVSYGVWEAPHNTMTITFNGEEPLIWTYETTSFKLRLIDLIESSLYHERETGVPAFAVKSGVGGAYLVSQTSDGRCLQHPIM